MIAFFGLTLLLTLILPQSPVPPADEAAFARWLAEIRPTLGSWTGPLADLGLLSLRTSWWQRLSLALLALAGAARCSILVENWNETGRLGRVRQVALIIGPVALIVGWGLQITLGWSKSGVIAWPGEPTPLEEHQLTLPVVDEATRLARHGYGLYSLREERALGLAAEAYNEEGEHLGLLASSRGEPKERLRLYLNLQQPDGFFALPSVGFVFRASLLKPPPETRIQVQTYRSSSDLLVNETVLEGSGSIFIDDLRLDLESTPLPQLRVIYNPGAPVMALGGVLLGVSGGIWVGGQLGWWRVTAQETAEKEEATPEAENEEI